MPKLPRNAGLHAFDLLICISVHMSKYAGTVSMHVPDTSKHTSAPGNKYNVYLKQWAPPWLASYLCLDGHTVGACDVRTCMLLVVCYGI